MTYRIQKTESLKGCVVLPASKSISNRALIIDALSKAMATPADALTRPYGQTETGLSNVSECDDTFVMTRALTDNPATIDIMAAGTAMRFLTAYLSVTEGEHTITGTERMRHRPIMILVEALRTLGASVEYVGEEGFPPLHVHGRQLEGGRLELPGNVSSQYISALLMIGPTMAKGLELCLTGSIISRPYIDMTLSIMRQFGAEATWTSPTSIVVRPKPYAPIPYYIESDWSASSYWYEMVALSEDEDARILLPALFAESLQGDSQVRTIFEQLGVTTEFRHAEGHTHTDGTPVESVVLTKSGHRVERLEWDMVNQPDLAQTVVVTCAMLGIPFRLTGLQSLKIKETDRIVALRTELSKLGYDIHEADDSILYWDGERTTPDPLPTIDTYEDHRMAMAFAPCCTTRDHLFINDPQVVSKSYPRFWDNLRQVGFIIEEA